MKKKKKKEGTLRRSVTADDILAPHSPRMVALAQRLRRLVRQKVPEAEERPYPVWRALGFRHPTAGYFCGIFPFKDYVALAFEYGVLLDDPDDVLKAGRTSRKKVRYLEVRSARDIRVGIITRLLRQAIALKKRP